MASTINSTGTSSGIVSTADASGVLNLQGGGNTGVSISATGVPTITTPAALNNSTGVASTAYVDRAAGFALPGGRLTLTTATPVLTANVLAAGTVYYTPYTNGYVPIYNGTSYLSTAFSELSNVLANSAVGNAGPAAATTNSNYDLFVWSNSGVVTLTRGPAWTSDTARGTGAGTTQISAVAGVWTNTVAITNGPGAGLGTYVGTIRTNGTSTVDWNPTPAAAAGGGNAWLGVWNAYNRVRSVSRSLDNTASWTYSTVTWRAADNSNSNRISYIDGLGNSAVDTTYSVNAGGNVSSSGTIGVNRDSTSATPERTASSSGAGSSQSTIAVQPFQPSIGFHYLQAMEWNNSSTATFYSTWISNPACALTAALEM